MNLAKTNESPTNVDARSTRPLAAVGVVAASSGTAANDGLPLAGATFQAVAAANARDAGHEFIDPVVLIHNERAETLRLLAQWIRQGYRALMGQSPAGTTA